MNLKRFLFAGSVFTVFALVACDKNDDNNNNNQLNTTDRAFMLNASLGNSAEINAANLAVSKSTTPQITAFAQQMITDHTTAQNELKSLGTSVGYAVSDSIDSAHVSIKQMLDTLSGRAFDSAYIYNQITDHQSAVTNFQTEQSSGQHSSVKSYANTYLPHIQAHLQTADSIATNLFPK